MVGAVSVEDWRQITERARGDAIDGDHRVVGPAREWLSKYLLPTPEQLVTLRGDGDLPMVVVREVVVERKA